MDENTVSANFVTFVNCLSLSERKVITMFLFCNKEFYKCNVCGEEASFLSDPDASHGKDVVMCCGQKMVYIGCKPVS